jgi:deoxycytidylate deaminase
MSSNKIHKLLKGYELFGWSPDPELSSDDNLMDLCMIVTRSSQLRQGSMACILVQEDKQNSPVMGIQGDIISVANNRSLFKEKDSDVHAEIVAISQVSRQGGVSTENATAFITMPPCKRCFGALMVAGIRRIVTRYDLPQQLTEAAKKNNITFVKFPNQAEQTARINILLHGDPAGRKKKNQTSIESEEAKSGKAL